MELRLCVITGRRFATAVARNRARRLLRETARVLLASVRERWDLLLVARPEVLTQPYVERRQSLCEVFHKAGILVHKAAAA